MDSQSPPSPTFSRLGGHPAVDFVNTQPLRNGVPVERLGSFEHLVAWLHAFDLITDAEAEAQRGFAGAQAAEQALTAALGLRERLRALFATVADGEAMSAERLAPLDQALATRSGRLALDTSGPGRLVFRGELTAPGHLLGLLAQPAVELLLSPDASRLKRCTSERCVLWFLDRSRNGSRHWCSMDSCGARAKAKDYYHRHRGTP